MTRIKMISLFIIPLCAAGLSASLQAKTIAPAASGRMVQIGTTSIAAAAVRAKSAGPESLASTLSERNNAITRHRDLSKLTKEMPDEAELMQRIRNQARRLRGPRPLSRKAPTGRVGGSNFPVVTLPENRVRRNRGNVFGFDGLNNRDQAGANGFSVEPPDQGLAIGNNQALEAVNLALAVYDPSNGVQFGPTVSLASFFKVPASQQLSDPVAYYDASTGHFFVSILNVDFANNRSFVLIAVSQTKDATGDFSIFKLDTTNDGTNGTPSDSGCPCLPDQPLLGADSNGIYISVNEFAQLGGDGFNGANVYAIDKFALADGNQNANFQLFQLGQFSFSVHPATTPPGGNFENAQRGTEYLLASLDLFGEFTNQIGVFALTNTSSLSSSPNLTLQENDIQSQFYADPPPIKQKKGPTPLLDALNNGFFGQDFGVKEEMVDSGDDRMQQVVFANGKLFAGLNSIVGVKIVIGPGGGFNDKNARAGIAYFVVDPGFNNNGELQATLKNGDYVAVRKNSVVYPSIGVNTRGRGVMAFSLIGPRAFPSSALVNFTRRGARGPVRIVAQGAAPDDGFTGYFPFVGGPNPGTARWGDYSAAVADDIGNIWMGTEYIPDRPRVLNANWGTFINRVKR